MSTAEEADVDLLKVHLNEFGVEIGPSRTKADRPNRIVTLSLISILTLVCIGGWVALQKRSRPSQYQKTRLPIALWYGGATRTPETRMPSDTGFIRATPTGAAGSLSASPAVP